MSDKVTFINGQILSAEALNQAVNYPLEQLSAAGGSDLVTTADGKTVTKAIADAQSGATASVLSDLADSASLKGDALVSVVQPYKSAKKITQSDFNADFVSVTHFKDANTTWTQAFQAVLNYATGKNVKCIVPDGSYTLGALTPSTGMVFWQFGANVTILGTLPFAPSKNQYGGISVDPSGVGSSTIVGSASVPKVDTLYTNPAQYIEMHTNSATADSCDWGNSKKKSASLAEVIVYANETGEVNGYATRVFSGTSAPSGAQGLVGISALAQSNAPTGSSNRDVWAANLIAASSTGNKPKNIVGIEVDVIPSQASSALRPGESGSDNFTAYWAQADGGSTATCNTAFYASENGSAGWQYGTVMDCHFQSYIGWWRNQVDSTQAKGLRIETQSQSSDGRILELFCKTNEQMRVDGDTSNPIWLRIDGTLKQVVPGDVDSGGVGYKVLRVLN